MTYEQPWGKVIITAREVVVKLTQPATTLQARHDAIKLFGRSPTVMVANDMECQWHIQLTDDQLVGQLAKALSIAID